MNEHRKRTRDQGHVHHEKTCCWLAGWLDLCGRNRLAMNKKKIMSCGDYFLAGLDVKKTREKENSTSILSALLLIQLDRKKCAMRLMILSLSLDGARFPG